MKILIYAIMLTAFLNLFTSSYEPRHSKEVHAQIPMKIK